MCRNHLSARPDICAELWTRSPSIRRRNANEIARAENWIAGATPPGARSFPILILGTGMLLEMHHLTYDALRRDADPQHECNVRECPTGSSEPSSGPSGRVRQADHAGGRCARLLPR